MEGIHRVRAWCERERERESAIYEASPGPALESLISLLYKPENKVLIQD